MVVCICNAIREKDLRAAVRCCSEKPNDVYARMGRKPKCGQCLSFARDIISGTLRPLSNSYVKITHFCGFRAFLSALVAAILRLFTASGDRP